MNRLRRYLAPSRAAATARGWPWALIAVTLLGVGATILLARSLHDHERRLFEAEFDRRAEERARVIERELRDGFARVESVAALFTTSDPVDRRMFHAFATTLLKRGPAIQALGFNPLVPGDRRREHEMAVRREGFPDYRITERAADGRLVAAGKRSSYVVAAFLEPLHGNEAALGFDIASEPTRHEALARARDTGAPAVTGRLTLVQEPESQYGALLCVPVYFGTVPATVPQRREALRGYAVGVLRIGDMVEHALRSLRPTGINLRLIDESAPEQQRLLYYHRSRTLTSPDAGAAPAPEGSPADVKSYGFEIAGRRWSVLTDPTPAFRAAHIGRAPGVVLLGGLLCTVLIVGYLSWQRSVNHRLRRAVSERQRAEERRASFGRVLDESHDELYVFAADSLRFLHVNRGARRNLGYSLSELQEMTPLDLKTEMTPESFAELVRPLLERQRDKIEFTTTHRRRDGTMYDVEVHLQLTTFDGEPAFVAVILDITQRKALEERMRQSRRLEALGALAGGIAHDINNLLTAIMGYTELSLDEVPPGSPVQGRLREVVKASERARDVVRRILTFSRRRPIERRAIDLGELLREALNLVRISLPSTIAMQEDLADDCNIVGDPTQIHQVLMNLCTNAAQAMRERGGTLDVRLETVGLDAAEAERLGDLAPGDYARISVRDTGHGISPTIVDRIFDPFFTTKKQGEGTGMGLAVAHGIVKGHGGAVGVASEPGRGATFEVYLPRSAAPSLAADEDDSAVTGGSETILVVDDEPAVVKLLDGILERWGYGVTAFCDGAEALDAFRAQPHAFDLVVSDYTMPGMKGTRLAGEIRNVDPDTPVILVSGYGDLVDEDELREAGIRALLTKPLRSRELAATVRRVLDAAAGTVPGEVPTATSARGADPAPEARGPR